MDRTQFKILHESLTQLVGETNLIAGSYEFPAIYKSIILKYDKDNIKNSMSKKIRVNTLSEIPAQLDANKDCGFLFIEVSDIGDKAYQDGKKPDKPIELEGWIYVENLSPVVSMKLKKTAAYYINPTTKQNLMIVDKIISRVEVNWTEYLLLKLMPWYFTDEECAANKEIFKKIFVCDWRADLTVHDQTVLKFCNDIYEASDIEKMRKHQMYVNMARMPQAGILRAIENLYNELRDRSHNVQSDIDEYKRRINNAVIELAKIDAEYIGAKAKRAEMEKSLEAINPESFEHFFEDYKGKIELTSCTEDEICITLFALLTGYDDDDIRKNFENRRSNINGSSWKTELKEILQNHRGIIRTIGKIKLCNNMQSLNYDTIDMNRERGYASHPNYFISPHWHAACQGANASEYHKLLTSGQWDTAIEQALWACSNWNIDDSIITSDVVDFLGRSGNSNAPNIWVHPDLSPIDDVDDSCILVSFPRFREMLAEQAEIEKRKAEEAKKAAEEAKRAAEIEARITAEAEKIAAAEGISVDEAKARATETVAKRIAAAKKSAESRAKNKAAATEA